MRYKYQLRTPEWLVKRKAILIRDSFTCVKCGSKKNLHVHHKKYTSGMAWEVPDEYLATLCDICHSIEHKIKPSKKRSKNKKRKVDPEHKFNSGKRQFIRWFVKLNITQKERLISELKDLCQPPL